MASRRRTRWEVTLSQGSVVTTGYALAYSADAVREWYTRRGYMVVSVTAARKPRAHNKIAKWALNHAALRTAQRELRLAWPVEIKLTGHEGGRYGAHTLASRNGQPMHKITVKNWLSPEQAGRTLWHELTHAMQAERAAAKFCATGYAQARAAWSKDPGRLGSYRSRAIEVEARSNERRNNDIPLAKGI